MSKERELLQFILNSHAANGSKLDKFWKEKIEELLAQPEQEVYAKGYAEAMKQQVYEAYESGRKSALTEQEPVAWMVETHFNNEPIKEFHTVKPMERVYKYCIVTELYSAPLKPLTGIEISNGFKADDEATHPYSYWAGVDFAEKHHGIEVEL